MKRQAAPLWTPREDERLRELLQTRTPTQIGMMLGRTRMAVKHRMRKLGLMAQVIGKLNPRTGRWMAARLWTKREEMLLWSLAGTAPVAEVARKLGRTRQATIQRCRRLGVRWNQGKLTATDLANDLGVDDGTVGRVARRLGMRRQPGAWTPWNFTEAEVERIAARLGRSVQSMSAARAPSDT